MTLDELKKRCHSAGPTPDLRVPRTTLLKLLEMIAVLRDGLTFIRQHESICPADTAEVNLLRAAEIERSL